MRRVLGLTALALAAAAFGGTAFGLPGGAAAPVQVAPSAARLDVMRCIGYQQLRIGLHNTTAEHQYGDLFLQPTGPLRASRLQLSRYAPIGFDVKGLPVRLTVPPDAAPGDYELGYRLGADQQAPTPVSVVADPAKQCVPPARMTASASTHQVDDVAKHAVDGDPDTLWRSRQQSLPATITIDLGGTYDISEVRYQPRLDGIANGDFGSYTLLASSDGTTFKQVGSGSWDYTDEMKTAVLATPARGVRKLRMSITAGSNGLAVAAEIIPIGVPVAGVPQLSATALTVPQAVVAGRPQTVQVAAGNWTDDPLAVEAAVDVPAGWTSAPVRAVIPPGVVTPIDVAVTPPAELPKDGIEPAVTLTAHAAPVGGGTADGAPTATTWVVPDVSTPVTTGFDAGSGPLMDGWTALGPWRDGALAGWVGGVPAGRDRGAPDALRGDHVFSTGEATLRVAVPPGRYDAALLRGDATATTGSLIVKADGATLAGPGSALQAGEFAWERVVLDGGRAGRTIDLTLSGDAGAEWELAALLLRRAPVQEQSGVGGTVPATLALSLGGPATFGAFMPGVDRDYDTSTSATVTSTAGDATLSAAGPVHLANGSFALQTPLAVSLSKATWSAPAANDQVWVAFRQHIGASEALRSGGYGGTVTLTLSTTSP